jgi:hypothetical protein
VTGACDRQVSQQQTNYMATKLHYLLLIFALLGFTGCKTSQLIHSSTPGNELFKVAILYPNGEGKTFDMDYYEKKHMPMVAGLLGSNLNSMKLIRASPAERQLTRFLTWLLVIFM